MNYEEDVPFEQPPDQNPLVNQIVHLATAARKHLWQPGQSGNPAGRPKGAKGQLAELKRNLEIAVRDNLNPEAIKDILGTMTALALAGDVKAAKLILDKVLTNASDGEEENKGTGTFVFQVKNLTLKHDSGPVISASRPTGPCRPALIDAEFQILSPTAPQGPTQ